jgi:UDP:flavonoid glycosyltransferase YjiC (YdhE family)
MSRILFVSPPFAGHTNPLRVLQAGAEAAGHQTRLFLGGDLQAQLLAVANSPVPIANRPWLVLAQLRQTVALLPLLAAALEEVCEDFAPHLIVADSVAIPAGPCAQRRNIPWITTIATPFAIENTDGTPSYCGGWSPGWPLRDWIGRNAIRCFKDLAALAFKSTFAAIGLPKRRRADGTEAIYSPDCILGFGLRELEFARSWPPAFEMIGPIIDSPISSQSIELGTPPRVLITLGTHLLWAKQAIASHACTLAQAYPHVNFIVSLGGAEGQVGPLADNLRVERYVHYAAQLKAFNAVIHHGGAGITYACLLHGKPSLVIPHDYDQFDYAARIVHHGLGLRASSFAAAAPLLEGLLAKDWPHLTQFSAYARAYRPVETFLQRVDQLLMARRTGRRFTVNGCDVGAT